MEKQILLIQGAWLEGQFTHYNAAFNLPKAVPGVFDDISLLVEGPALNPW
ncbi:MAG: hypothetical protein MUO57_10030 [Anaerolineales bacterium]|nr:hypothetical protein [Anaerolineales bacterium]